MSRTRSRPVALAQATALLVAATTARAGELPRGVLDDVIVTATLRTQSAASLPASVTVLDAATLGAAGSQHLEDVLGLVPNLNWSAGSARPRYFQLRGIGELEQYEGAPNPSVGFLVDDMDFSGLGMVATLFDLERVEVLRGPQGTRYGANALGGLIYVRSQAPTEALEARTELGAADFATRSAGAVVSGALPGLDSAARLAVQHYRSDGFYHNVFLGRPTDGRDETTARLRWRYAPSPELGLDLAVLHATIDDGYDAFAIDNSRYVRSDHPGEDTQHANGASLRATYSGLTGQVLTLVTSQAHSLSTQSYDGDWGNALLWSPYAYDYTYRAESDRTTRSVDLRLEHDATARGTRWLFGAYAQELAERVHEVSVGNYVDPLGDYAATTNDRLDSRWRARSYALYGQLEGRWGQRLTWSAGLRGERRGAHYADQSSTLGTANPPGAFAPRDNMAGGHFSLSYAIPGRGALYATAARGYKAGGFNLSQGLPANQRTFRPESLLNLEAGYKADLAARRLHVDAALFYMRRHGLQLRSSEQLVQDDPNSFVFYTGNAGRGYNAGLEASLRWLATPALEFGASLGLLRTRFEDLALVGVPVASRAQPHAPSWQAAFDAAWHAPSGWFARLDVNGVGAYYFDVPPNNTASRGYVLTSLRAGFERYHWSVAVYGHNLFDRGYAVRGFYFGNEPPDFPNKLYTQLGAPRQVGVTVNLRL